MESSRILIYKLSSLNSDRLNIEYTNSCLQTHDVFEKLHLQWEHRLRHIHALEEDPETSTETLEKLLHKEINFCLGILFKKGVSLSAKASAKYIQSYLLPVDTD